MRSFDFERVVTTGSRGMVGSYVDFGLRTDHTELDVLDETSVRQFLQSAGPTAILHLAGATDMERCERDPSYAYELNARGTLNVARAAAALRVPLVYLSTSRVFSGTKKTPYTEHDAPDPTTHYGRSKRLGELITETIAPQHLIVRTCWVFGGGPQHDNKFFGNVIRQLGNAEIMALSDVHGSPTYGKDLIGAIKELLVKRQQGYVHVSNGGAPTRAAIARKLVRITGAKAQVRPVTRSYFSSGAVLPENESIVSKTVHLRPWQDALGEYIQSEWAGYLADAVL